MNSAEENMALEFSSSVVFVLSLCLSEYSVGMKAFYFPVL